MCVYAYVCHCACVWMGMCVCVREYMRMRVYVCVSNAGVYVCVYVCSTGEDIGVYVYVCAQDHEYACMCMYVRYWRSCIHKLTHIHTHAHVGPQPHHDT